MSFWKEKRVLVTGATGFVGSHLIASLLEQEAEVVCLIRDLTPQSPLLKTGCIQKTHVVCGMLEDFNTVERAINDYEIDSVFHLGAQTLVETAVRSPLPTFESNIRGTYHLLESCRRQRFVKRILIASSDKAYGTSPLLPYSEEMPLIGRHPYDVSKSCADLISHCYYHSYDLPIVIARSGNLYGGGDLNWSRLIPGTIKTLLQEKSPHLRSDGTYQRDYLYIKDAVEGYLLLCSQASESGIQGEAFNFAPSCPYTVMEVVHTLQKLLNSAERIKIENRISKEIHSQFLNSHKAFRLLGWKAKFTLEEGLKETIKWYEDHLLQTLAP